MLQILREVGLLTCVQYCIVISSALHNMIIIICRVAEVLQWWSYENKRSGSLFQGGVPLQGNTLNISSDTFKMTSTEFSVW